jgi:hypothetical protein
MKWWVIDMQAAKNHQATSKPSADLQRPAGIVCDRSRAAVADRTFPKNRL